MSNKFFKFFILFSVTLIAMAFYITFLAMPRKLCGCGDNVTEELSATYGYSDEELREMESNQENNLEEEKDCDCDE